MKRRELLAGLAAGVGVGLTAGCGRVEFLAANIPASFGAYRRHADVPYGPEPEHLRLGGHEPSQEFGQPARIGPGEPLHDRRLGDQERAGNLCRTEPTHRPQRQRHLRVALDNAGWQQVNIRRNLSSSPSGSSGSGNSASFSR